MRERETRQAAEDKTVGLQFLLGLVFTGLAEPGKRTGKHNNKKTEMTVKKLLRPFQSCGEEHKNILDHHSGQIIT